MFLNKWLTSPSALSMSFSFAALILVLVIDLTVASDSYLNKLKPDTETKTNFRIFLNNMKIRHVPLAKETSENHLARLYKRERHLREDIEELQKNLVLEDNSAFAASNVELIKASLEDLSHQLLGVQTKIRETKRVIKDPKNSIMVPSGYGRDPEEQREREKEQLIRDRENSNYRGEVLDGKIQPSWLTDEW